MKEKLLNQVAMKIETCLEMQNGATEEQLQDILLDVNTLKAYMGFKVNGAESKNETALNIDVVTVSTSKDYKRLFEMISKGLIIPCFVDYDWRDGSTPSRDIAKVRRFKENDIQIGARGIQYGGVEDFSLHGRTEFEAFAEECNRMNLEYCC